MSNNNVVEASVRLANNEPVYVHVTEIEGEKAKKEFMRLASELRNHIIKHKKKGGKHA